MKQPISTSTFRLLVSVCLALCLCWFAVAGSHAADRRPNVILIITDDQGYGDLRCHGNTMINTPNLDRLHGQSVRLTDFHVDPTCSPTRAALLTGRYSSRTGVWHTIMGRSLMYHDESTLPEAFAANGYRNAIIGKWHLGENYPMRPQDRGFHEVLIHGGGGIGQTPDYWLNDYFDDTYFRNGKPEKFKGYCTDVFFDEALKFIEKSRGKPFFLYLPTNVPHGPYFVAEKYSKPYVEKGVPQQMANFYGMIENFDENMGRLMARLKDLQLEEDTILIFMTDNGSSFGVPAARKGAAKADEKIWSGFNAGMRGQKGSEYDGGHRVPFFIRWPKGGLAGGRDVTRLTAHTDVLPTLVELCGLTATFNKPIDGTSLVPLLRGPSVAWPDRTLFVHSQRIEYPEKWRQSAVMTERWRLVNGKELHDIKAEPAQQKNVADEHPQVFEKLRQAYDAWWASLVPRFDDYGWIGIGSAKENPVHITAHDWHAPQAEVPWHQDQIQKDPWANGYWMIEVTQNGAYEFILRQRPDVANFPIQAKTARIKVGDAEVESSVPEGATEVRLRLQLPAGKTKMQTWFTTEDGKSRGAFYVEVKRL